MFSVSRPSTRASTEDAGRVPRWSRRRFRRWLPNSVWRRCGGVPSTRGNTNWSRYGVETTPHRDQFVGLRRLAVDLEEAGGALAAADAHRHDAPLGAAALTLLEDVAGAPCAGHAERVPDRDRAAVDVVLLGIDAEPVAAVEALRRECLV